MPTTVLPADWEVLGRFRDSGPNSRGTPCLRTRLPQGMDPATLLSQVRLSEEMVGMSPELDACSRYAPAEALPLVLAQHLQVSVKRVLQHPCLLPPPGQPDIFHSPSLPRGRPSRFAHITRVPAPPPHPSSGGRAGPRYGWAQKRGYNKL